MCIFMCMCVFMHMRVLWTDRLDFCEKVGSVYSHLLAEKCLNCKNMLDFHSE